jgi:hypothetical protein
MSFLSCISFDNGYFNLSYEIYPPCNHPTLHYSIKTYRPRSTTPSSSPLSNSLNKLKQRLTRKMRLSSSRCKSFSRGSSFSLGFELQLDLDPVSDLRPSIELIILGGPNYSDSTKLNLNGRKEEQEMFVFWRTRNLKK